MKTNFLRKSAIAVFTMTAASFYFAQEQEPEKENNIEEVVLVGVADIAKDRKTPVAVSTIKEGAIVEKLGNKEFPEVLNSTPSVYATKTGGGFGDGKISIRGFNQRNIAVMVNGMPINDMLNGAVYWSNWAGLADVTSAMQVQRGLGASKLAIVSVGGTINVLTRSADKKQGGTLTVGVANDGYHKSTFAYNTGKTASGWASSFLMSRTAGAMYGDNTDFEGYNYYFALGYQPNTKHDLQFTITGAPQWHHQRYSAPRIEDYLKYGGNEVDRPNRRYSSDWGYITRENGVKEAYSTNRNHYHKPIASLNWDWKMTDASKLSSVLYASFGRGGGTTMSSFRIPKTADGLYDWDALVASNKAGTTSISRHVNGNSHDWYGFLTNFQHKVNDNLNFSVGVDGRYFIGYRYNLLQDLLGNANYVDKSNKNLDPNGRIMTREYKAEAPWNPLAAVPAFDDRITYNLENQVLWYGAFGQIEYSNDYISAFLQGAISNQGYKRVDHFLKEGTISKSTGLPMPQATDFTYKLGFNIKGGINFNINENHNVFANAGYYEKQPFFNAIYRYNENIAFPNNTNEKILGLELGYGLRLEDLTANVNLYRTEWKDVYTSTRATPDAEGTRYIAEINGLNEIHQGIEVDANYRYNEQLSFTGMFSIGDWYYKGNANAFTLNSTTYQPHIVSGLTSSDFDLYLDNAKVGDAAQITASLGIELRPLTGLKLDANWRYVDRLYAALDPMAFREKERASKGTLRLPSYNLLDFGVSYKLELGDKKSLTFRGNVDNVLDTVYIAESTSSIYAGDSSSTNKLYKGIDTGNTVYFGYGRTWSASVSFNF